MVIGSESKKEDKIGKAFMQENQTLRFIAIIVLVIVSIVSAVFATDAIVFNGKAHQGVTVAGKSVSRMDENRVMLLLDRMELTLNKKKVQIVSGNKSWLIKPSDLGISIDKAQTVDDVFEQGRKGNLSEKIRSRTYLWFKNVEIEPRLNYDIIKMDALIRKIGKKIEKSPSDSAIKIVDGSVITTPSKTGLGINKTLLVGKLQNAFLGKGPLLIKLPIMVTKPDLSEQQVELIVDDVKQMIESPIVAVYKDNKWDLSQKEISNWIQFNKVRQGDHWTLDVSLDKDLVATTLEDVTSDISVKAKDAEFRIVKDKVEIAPSSNGTKVDFEKAYEDLLDASKTVDSREIELATTDVAPKLTTEDATKMGIQEKVASYMTSFNPNQSSRVHNIKLLSSALDGVIIPPGESFSFNGAIGPRTAAKGYREAPAIINGELVPSLGGGVCQVATTLFNTIFFGGYEVVERHNHSFFISHYPTGRDATVSWGGPDLKFKNDSQDYLLVKTWTTASTVTISFFSTKRNIKVSYTTAGPSNFKSSRTEYKNDANLPKGVKKVIDRGYSGRDVTVVRTVLKDDQPYHKDRFFSRYTPKKTVVALGVGEVAPVKSTDTKPNSGQDQTPNQIPSGQEINSNSQNSTVQ